MKLTRSRLTDISCTKCSDIIPSGVLRFKSGNMHSCAPACPVEIKLSDCDTLTLLTNDWVTSK